MIIAFKDKFPQIDETVYIAPNAVITGDVVIGLKSSIWPGVVLRGDVAPIKIGSQTNIQDGSVVHTSRHNGPTHIGNNVTIGHMALVHAATVNDYAFIGMRATIMDFAVVEEWGFLAAGALLTPKKIVRSRELWAGIPAKFIRMITEDEIAEMKDNNSNYVELARSYSHSY